MMATLAALEDVCPGIEGPPRLIDAPVSEWYWYGMCLLLLNVGDHVMPEQSVFCRPDELGWAYVILQTCT